MKPLIQAHKHKTLQALKHKNSTKKALALTILFLLSIHLSSKEGKLLYNLRNNCHIVGCYFNCCFFVKVQVLEGICRVKLYTKGNVNITCKISSARNCKCQYSLRQQNITVWLRVGYLLIGAQSLRDSRTLGGDRAEVEGELRSANTLQKNPSPTESLPDQNCESASDHTFFFFFFGVPISFFYSA